MVADGFGGYVPTETLVKSVWAEIVSNTGQKTTGIGFADFINPVTFRIRGKANNLNLSEKSFVKYKGVNYEIKGLEDVGIENREVNIYTDGN